MKPSLAAVGADVSPDLAVRWIVVVEDDLDPVGDPLALMETHPALGGLHTAHGHLVQQLGYRRSAHSDALVILRRQNSNPHCGGVGVLSPSYTH